jgi:hypothetical protein
MSLEVFEEMIGATIESIHKTDDDLSFRCTDGRVFRFYHYQSCCESVYIESVTGDLEDLIGSPLVMAEEVSNMDAPEPNVHRESYTWTFYRYGTAKGSVTVRWLGTSNGYYSESVYFEVL